MTLLLRLIVALTYTDAPTEDGQFEPSLLLRWVGGWNDIAVVDDARVLPATPAAEDSRVALENLQASIAALPDGEDPEVERLMAMSRDREEWDQVFAERMIKRYAGFFDRVEAMMAGPPLTLPVPTNPVAPYELFKVVNWPRYYQLLGRIALERGDWHGALGAVQDMNRLSNYVLSSPGPMIHYLVGVAMEKQTLAHAQRLLDDPSLPPAFMPPLGEVLKEEPDHEPIQIEMWKQEFAFQRNAVRALAEGLTIAPPDLGAMMLDEPPPRFDAWKKAGSRCLQQAGYAFALQPNKTVQLQVGVTEHLIRMSALPARRRIEFAGPEILWERPALIRTNAIGERVVYEAGMQLPHALNRSDLIIGYRRALLVGWGVRHYHELHGELPDTLAQVTRRHLKEIPADPFDGKPVRYSREKERIWVVGVDMIDHGGTDEDKQRNFGRENILLDEEEGYDPSVYLKWLSR